jgi:hypothetical protein
VAGYVTWTVDDDELTVGLKEAFMLRDPEEKASRADSENDIQSLERKNRPYHF